MIYMDLTSEKGVEKHMKAATSQTDWNRRAAEVQAANGGKYPEFWFSTIMVSGLAAETQLSW
jgi:hypothetical protein